MQEIEKAQEMNTRQPLYQNGIKQKVEWMRSVLQGLTGIEKEII